MTWNVTQAIGDLSLGGNSSDELRGVVINATLAQATPSGVAGLRVKTITTGSNVEEGGAWGNGAYFEISEGTAGSGVHGTTGYITAGEFQTTIAGTWTALTWGIVSLNAKDNRSSAGSQGAYFILRSYGTCATNDNMDLFSFYDSSYISTYGTGKTVVTSVDKAATHMIKINLNGTQAWILATTNAPSS